MGSITFYMEVAFYMILSLDQTISFISCSTTYAATFLFSF